MQTWRPATLLKRDFNTDVFLWISRNFWEQLHRTPLGDCFWQFHKFRREIILHVKPFFVKPATKKGLYLLPCISRKYCGTSQNCYSENNSGWLLLSLHKMMLNLEKWKIYKADTQDDFVGDYEYVHYICQFYCKEIYFNPKKALPKNK